MNRELTGKELFLLFQEKKNLEVLVVDDSQYSFDDSYASNDMKATVTDISFFEKNVLEDRDGDVLLLSVNWNSFEKNNIPLETNDFYLTPKSFETGSMKEANQFPTDGIEKLYIMENRKIGFSLFTTSISHSATLTSMWEESENGETYIEWLENQIEV